MSILSTYLKVKFQKLAEPAEPQLNLYDVYKKEYIPFFFFDDAYSISKL